MTACQPKRHEEKRERPPLFGFSFCMFFLLPLGLPCVNWARQKGCLVYLRSLTSVLRLSFVLFSGAFPFLIFWSLPFWTPFSYSNYLTILRRMYFITKGRKSYCKAPSWEFIDQIMFKTETLPATRWIALMGKNWRKRDKLGS